ncbi:MAG: hypothetical protein ACKVQW_07345 [Pyrinomonadaceae bacterium]
MKEMIRFVLSIVFLAFVLIITLVVISYGEATLLKESYVVLPLEIDKYDNSLWVEVFQTWAVYGVFLAAGFSLMWLIVGQFKFRPEKYGDAGGRMPWVSFLIALLLLTLTMGYFLTPGTQDFGKPLALSFYLVNSFFIYWFSSVMFSPSTVKYAPWLSYRLAMAANGLMRTFQGAAK